LPGVPSTLSGIGLLLLGIPWWTLAGRAQLVATSHERDLDLALAEVRRDQIRQIEEERSRREPRKRRKSRYRTT